MKICPTCRKTYDDASLRFCLDDGASLREVTGNDPDATWNISSLPMPPTVAAPRQTVPVQPTLTARPEQFQAGQFQTADRDELPRRSAWPWIFAMVAIAAFAVVLSVWLLTRSGGGDRVANSNGPVREPSITRTPEPTPETPKGPFTVFDNSTLNGSRITYYPRPTFELCQSDCTANSACKGFTWIRPGAYNQSDPAMCYLMSEVTDKVSHNCCISAEKN